MAKSGGSANKGHRVLLVKDTYLKYPELWMSVYIEGPSIDTQNFPDMFARARCFKADSPDKADLVVFTGGPDVNPKLYGEEKHPSTQVDDIRDAENVSLYNYCYKNGIPMLGVCRGAQFLHVMNGGKLFQHVDGHYGDHFIFDVKDRTKIEKVSSVHHQMCRNNPSGGMEVIATSSRSRNRWYDFAIHEQGMQMDIEAFFYRDTCCFGVQGHPEYKGYFEFAKWTLDYLNKFINENPDIVVVNKNYRLKQDILDMRPKTFDASKFITTN